MLATLPKDVIGVVCNHLSVLDRVALSCVSGAVRRAVDSHDAGVPGLRAVLASRSTAALDRAQRRLSDVFIVIVGPPQVGKTTLAIVYTTNAVPGEYKVPVYDPCTVAAMVGSEPHLLTIVDTAPVLDEALGRTCAKADVAICCYDSRRAETALELRDYVRFVRACCGRTMPLVVTSVKANGSPLAEAALHTWMPQGPHARVGTYQEGLRTLFDVAATAARQSPKKSDDKCTAM